MMMMIKWKERVRKKMSRLKWKCNSTCLLRLNYNINNYNNSKRKESPHLEMKWTNMMNNKMLEKLTRKFNK